jgi:cell fate (sporulation/competence/biofilm development) regulator YlbF (YheA/YmcA/DUF963 family)
MQKTNTENQIIQKTRELCQAILDHPELSQARQRISAFMSDEKARTQYDGLVNKGQELQQKQQSSQPLSGEEIAAFEKDRDSLMNNPVARGFLDAQEAFHSVHHSINKYVSKTLELGRVPTDDDFPSEECKGDGSCGCGHNH